jgi:two-component system chemotaxis response regulator CheB
MNVMQYKVVVVDDSPFMRKIISDLIERDPSFQVVGTADNGLEAILKVSELKPDIVTMDVEMPEMNGLEALQTIMKDNPIPIIMLSGINEEGLRETILALEAGAFDFIRKPSANVTNDIDQVGEILLDKMKVAMQAKERRIAWQAEELVRSEKKKVAINKKINIIPASTASQKPSSDRKNTFVINSPTESVNSLKGRVSPEEDAKNVKRTIGLPKVNDKPAQVILKPLQETMKVEGSSTHSTKQIKLSVKKHDASIPLDSANSGMSNFQHLVAIGCSTGGPRALKEVLERIPGDLPAPVVIVQHMPPKFTKSLAQRLNSFSALEVVEGEHGMVLNKGHAYIAPGGYHMTIMRASAGHYEISLSEEEPRNGHRPSAEAMFDSLLPFTKLHRHVILLTGMGSDGAKAMKRLYDSGVTDTYAESEETCVVYGMPRSAVELNCVSHILPIQEIPRKLIQMVK